MKHNNREYLIMIMSGTLTMFSGGFVWPIFAAYVRTEFSAPLQLVGLAVSGYFMLRMLTEFPIAPCVRIVVACRRSKAVGGSPHCAIEWGLRNLQNE